ncbi:gamma-glutamyl-gamma-aminobutyrate hydrolase family protein [Duganella sp. CT11-25]|uniref:gamma-glutamyl-gamma-aminobutyrate hydrolase family protein n=1 Tax=unclassified Duganella TaxID=2636909 RepID=UPI0039AF9EA2
MRRPIVLVPACVNQIGAHPYHTAQLKYVAAVADGANCAPLIIPALGAATDIDALLAVADGVMLTGSPSNVHAGLYGEALLDPSLPLDAARDATTLPLIRAAIQRGIPLLAICRGFQEVNVALGGTLHQAVHHVTGMADHREQKSHTLEQQYAPSHRVLLDPGGRMAQILGGISEIMVNSLHGQGINRLAPGLAVEARADDGLVEAYRVADAIGFTLAVQWHPEWRFSENPDSIKLFTAFGEACTKYQHIR